MPTLVLLQGRKPAELPIERPTKFELVLNLRAAQSALAQKAYVRPAIAQTSDRVPAFCCNANVRFWHKADMLVAPLDVRFRG